MRVCSYHKTLTHNSNGTLVANPIIAHWPFQTHGTLSAHEPPGLAQEVWPRSRTEGCALAATIPTLPNKFSFTGRITPCSLFLIPTTREMACWVMGFVIF